jgi:hypothetical protein
MNNVDDTSHTSLNDIARAIAENAPYDAIVRKVCDMISTDPKVDEPTLLTIARLVVDAMTAQFRSDV